MLGGSWVQDILHLLRISCKLDGLWVLRLKAGVIGGEEELAAKGFVDFSSVRPHIAAHLKPALDHASSPW